MKNANTDLNEAQIFKPWLRFGVGEVVHLKSDLKRRTPITIALIIFDSDEIDYRCTWMSAQKTQEIACFHDLLLTL
jgi:uncharacterized protein YodC (DUF2158 family)